MYMMASVGRLLMYMTSEVHLIANAVNPSVASEVHDGICSTPVGKYSTPSEAPDLHDGICTTLDGLVA